MAGASPLPAPPFLQAARRRPRARSGGAAGPALSGASARWPCRSRPRSSPPHGGAIPTSPRSPHFRFSLTHFSSPPMTLLPRDAGRLALCLPRKRRRALQRSVPPRSPRPGRRCPSMAEPPPAEPAGRELRDRLSLWDRRPQPAAPLSDRQTDSVLELKAAAENLPVPPEVRRRRCPGRREGGRAGERQAPRCHVAGGGGPARPAVACGAAALPVLTGFALQRGLGRLRSQPPAQPGAPFRLPREGSLVPQPSRGGSGRGTARPGWRGFMGSRGCCTLEICWAFTGCPCYFSQFVGVCPIKIESCSRGATWFRSS